MVGSSFVSDADVTEMLNVSLTELVEFMVGVYENFFSASYTLVTVSGTDEYDLSAVSPGIFKLLGVDLLFSATSGDFASLKSFPWAERDRYSTLGVWGSPAAIRARRPRYCLLGSKLKMLPAPDAAYSVKLTYVPKATPLAALTDALPTEIQPGWEEYIVCGAAKVMLAKEQNDLSFCIGEQDRVKKRIEAIAPNRDADAAPVMVRYEREDDFFDDEVF